MEREIIIQDCAALGRKVRELRRTQGVTQVQLAGLANTGVRFISDLENGKETCHIGKILSAIQTLGFDIAIIDPYAKR